jgi:uncharacterized protein YndB with AHSA1/START domain
VTTFRSSREIPASPDEIFAAFTDPQRLARWWGPAGFTNTFHVCEFQRGGRWEFATVILRGCEEIQSGGAVGS